MGDFYDASFASDHDHVFLDAEHEKNERKTWAVIVLCALMMAAEIIGGSVFDSLALVADDLHMSTHAGAMLIAALACTYARRYVYDLRSMFGTGKLDGLAGYTSAIILAMIALLIGYEAVARFFSPVLIHFAEATPIAIVGLLVDIASAWFLSGGDHYGHSHGHSYDHHHGAAHDDAHDHGEDVQHVTMPAGVLTLSTFRDGMPPVFRLAAEVAVLPNDATTVTTTRPDGARQEFVLARKSDVLESITDIPESYAFIVVFELGGQDYTVVFEEHDHGYGHEGHYRDHNMRAAHVHVLADVFVSVPAIIGLLLAKTLDWLWMDPLVGMVDTLVTANWSYGPLRDIGGILVDTTPDKHTVGRIRIALEADGDALFDLHMWRIGPGRLGAVMLVGTRQVQRGPQLYHGPLRWFSTLSHVTVEVHPLPTE